MKPPIEIVHFADPWCWWSWGLEPILQRLKNVYGDSVRVTYKMGGQFDSLAAWMKEYGVDGPGTITWISESVAMTNMPVHPDYYFRTGVTSSYPACRAFKAAEIQSESLAERYLRRMMEAFSLECRPATTETLVEAATEVGLDGDRLRRDLVSREVEDAFLADRREMARSGVNFLSLMIRNDSGESVVKGETFASRPFEEIIDRLAPGLPKRSPPDILEYLEELRGLVTAGEIASVFRIPVPDSESRLAGLAGASLLERRDLSGITVYRWRGEGLERLPLDVVRLSHVPSEVQVETASDLLPIVTKAVQTLYTEVATRPDKGYHFPLGFQAVSFIGYPEADVAALPSTAVESFAGVGYPFATESIRPGDTVLDIGSGSGTDVLFARLRVGAAGHVYGLDITPAMIEKARGNIRRMGVENVEILEGNATKIPLPDGSVDVVTSNGVLNLVPDKASAFREIFRVLKPGGRLQLADIVVQEDVGAVCGLNPQLWADCIGGAAVEADYLRTIEEAGFRDLRTVSRLDYFSRSGSESTKRITKTFGAESVVLAARKP